MMTKISVFYHCVLRGPGINPDHALTLLQQQMAALQDSGLESEAQRLVIGVNGRDGDLLTVASLAPESAHVIAHHDGQSELSTLKFLRANLKPGQLVLYHHMKGVTYPDNTVWSRWRKCMERVCVWNWQLCVRTLVGGGFDTVGAHWMNHKQHSIIPNGQRYWGGNFFWATSEYLLTLPPLPEDTRENRYEAEVWIGKSPRPPRIFDFAPHFPMNCPA